MTYGYLLSIIATTLGQPGFYSYFNLEIDPTAPGAGYTNSIIGAANGLPLCWWLLRIRHFGLDEQCSWSQAFTCGRLAGHSSRLRPSGWFRAHRDVPRGKVHLGLRRRWVI